MDNKDEIKAIHSRRRRRTRRRLILHGMLYTLIMLIIGGSVCLIADQCKTNTENISDEKADMKVINSPTPNTSTIMTITPKARVTPAPTEPLIERRGCGESIPNTIREIMNGKSMPSDATVGYDDLVYLTIPHYDFNYNIVNGHMIVNGVLEDEVLDIFAELFDIRYPIECMQIVDYYDADDYTSIENNNTSAFNYRESTDGSGKLSQHALGCAIDINPQINPYVNSNGTGEHQNAKEYWSRNISSWTSEIAKAAYIGRNTDIYDIFVNKYGWEWGGDWSTYRDYQHFQKKID